MQRIDHLAAAVMGRIGKSSAFALASLTLSGCMVAGMSAMGHGGTAGGHDGPTSASMRPPPMVTEAVGNGIRLTVDFPAYSLGDALAYTARVRDAGSGSFIADAVPYMIVMPQAEPGAPHEGHGSRLAPIESHGDTFVFRPTMVTEGAYRVVVGVERAGATASGAAVQIEQTIQLTKPMIHQPVDRSWLTGVTPIAVIGAAAMAVMMLLVFR